MVWYEDLYPMEHRAILGVGWLDKTMSYPKDDVDPRFVKKLADLLVDPWYPYPTLSSHRCDFCRFSRGPVFVSIAGRSLRIGDKILFVPGDGKLYAAPNMIVHYIDSHEYAPPEEFVAAVLKCPAMDSEAYRKAVEPFLPYLAQLARGT